MTTEEKVRRFHYPEVGLTCFDRWLSVAFQDDVLWLAVQMEKDRKNTIAVKRKRADATDAVVLEPEGFCLRPSLTPVGRGRVAVAWCESDARGWHVNCAELGEESETFEDVSTVFSTEGVLLPVATTAHDGTLWLAWPATTPNGCIGIHVARKRGPEWELLGVVSDRDVDAFRPSLAAGGQGAVLSYDQYRRGSYEVVVQRFAGAGWDRIDTLSREGERWFCSRVAAAPDGPAYVSWVVMREVMDDLGVVDHVPFGMAGRVEDQGVAVLEDPANPEDSRIVADCREGLLASDTYLGYHGNRRFPYLAASDTGALWVLWEVRLEERREHLDGHLAGRKLNPDGTWSAPRFLCEGAYSFAVPQSFPGEEIPVGRILAEGEGLDVIDGTLAAPDKGEPYAIDPGRWSRWKSVDLRPPPKPEKRVEADGKTYSLFWTDTHCHCVLSPDAEGEPDELIHYGRDIAGLDAICLLDNGFYPHKSLTEAEWRLHQALATHFTHEGRYVVFPGYEYSYHRSDLTPNLNHRAVVFPRASGPQYRRIDPEGCTDEKLHQSLRGSGAMAYPHHGTYKLVAPDLEWNVEVVSSWSVNIEQSDFTIQRLREGAKFGFIGSSDTHRSVPGLGGALTGVFAEELTPESLFEAYQARRVFATQGEMIAIDFRVSGVFMGGEGDCAGAPEIALRVEAPREIEFVEVHRDGSVIRDFRPGTATTVAACTDTDAAPGEHFYHVRLKLAGDPSHDSPGQQRRYPHNLACARGPFAWTSPVWITIAD